MPYEPLSLALSQPTSNSGGSSKWARILGAGLTGASFLPQMGGNPNVKNAMLTGGLGMLGSGSYWGGLAGVPSLLGGLGGKKPLPSTPVPGAGPSKLPTAPPGNYPGPMGLPSAPAGNMTGGRAVPLGGGGLPETSALQQAAIQKAMSPPLMGGGPQGPFSPASLPQLPQTTPGPIPNPVARYNADPRFSQRPHRFDMRPGPAAGSWR